MMVSAKLMLESALARFERGTLPEPSGHWHRASGSATRCAKCGASRARASVDARRPRPRRARATGASLAPKAASTSAIRRSRTAAPGRCPKPSTPRCSGSPRALSNIVHHAQASRAAVTLDVGAQSVMLTIADNGCGFDAERFATDARRGIGLRNATPRRARRLTITSQVGPRSSPRACRCRRRVMTRSHLDLSRMSAPTLPGRRPTAARRRSPARARRLADAARSGRPVRGRRSRNADERSRPRRSNPISR